MEDDIFTFYKCVNLQISIHVLRVEDDVGKQVADFALGISIHVLRVEDDFGLLVLRSVHHDFNPRPPCGGRPLPFAGPSGFLQISIHVLRVEDDSLVGVILVD